MENASENKPTEDRSSLIFNQVKHYLLHYYAPAHDVFESEFHMTTQEVFDKLFLVYPFPDVYGVSTIAVWLNEGGFVFKDFGEMRFEWLFKRNQYL